jgi:hypothetical protein
MLRGGRWLFAAGGWKHPDHKGSGGNNYKTLPRLRPLIIADTVPTAPGQLYNLEQDPGETVNLSGKHPAVVKQLKEKLEAFKTSGRSR